MMGQIHNSAFPDEPKENFGPVQFHDRPFLVPLLPLEQLQRLLALQASHCSDPDQAKIIQRLYDLLEDQDTRIGSIDIVSDSVPVKTFVVSTSKDHLAPLLTALLNDTSSS